jgi:uncharacterized protein YndB with AHSA1/START domain
MRDGRRYDATRRLLMSASPTDRIVKTIDLEAPRSRVWKALSDPKEFGAWFGVRMQDPKAKFVPGARVLGNVVHPGYEHVVWDIVVQEVEPERLLSWHWHPHAVEKGVDYSKEPPTLVVFELGDAPGGTRVTVTESGFDRIPLARRANAYRMNDGGWAAQLEAIARHVA